MKKHISVYFILYFVICSLAIASSRKERVYLGTDFLYAEDSVLVLAENVLYSKGDNRNWIDPEYDDSDWGFCDTRLVPDDTTGELWNGIGCFRYHFDVADELWGKPIALHMVQSGASEVYLNGKLVTESGIVGRNSSKEIAYWEQDFPKYVVLGNRKHQVMVVRYSNHNTKMVTDYGYGRGFHINLSSLETGISQRTERDKMLALLTALFIGLPLIFALLHILMFFFYKKEISNLFFGIITLCLAVVTFIDYLIVLAGSPTEYVILNLINILPSVVSVIFLLLFVYESFRKAIPKNFVVFITGGIVLQILTFLQIPYMNTLITYYTVIAFIEMARVITVALYKREVKVNILIVGLIFFVITSALHFTARSGINYPFVIDPLYYFGILVLIVTMSIHLSQNFAKIHFSLEREIENVKILSANKLQKEREEKEKEIARKLLEADNERKTKELIEARDMQISMLPKVLPDYKGLEISAFMKTATEVGGDYYDFFTCENGKLKIVIGDATGHGMKAGTLVSSTKSLFAALAPKLTPLEMINGFNRVFLDMKLKGMFMALLSAEYKDNVFTLANSGMPPVLKYNKAEDKIETIILKSMPLGFTDKFRYSDINITVNEGDYILFSSDGLMELFDKHKRMLGIDGMKKFFRESLAESTEEVLENLKVLIHDRLGENPVADDLTLLVIKRTEN